MKLGIISPYPPIKGGIASETEAIYHILSTKYDIEIISYNKMYPTFLYPDDSQYDYSIKNIKKTNINFLLNSFNPFSWKKSTNKILKTNCSHFIIRFWNPFFIPFYLYLIKKIRGYNNKIKIYCICDNIVPHERIIFDKYLIQYFFRKFNGYIVMSNISLNLLMGMINKRKLIIKSFLPLKNKYQENILKDEALKALNIKKPKLLLLMFGLVRDYEGLDVVLNSLKYLKEYDIKLLIAGKCYSSKNKYIKIIKDNNLNNMVIWHDNYIPESKVNLYFSATDAVILSHKNISQSGTIPLSYHFNKLILASNLDSFKEHIDDSKTGYLFNKNDVQSLSNTIKHIYKNHDFKLSESYIKNYKTRYSDQKILADYDSLFRL